MFEYLMPLLVMPTYEDTLLDQTYKAAVKRQIEYGSQRGVPWGISESRLQHVRRRTQLPVPRLRRARPGAETRPGRGSGHRALCHGPGADGGARGGMREPAAARRRGPRGRYGFYEAIDYTPSRLPRGQSQRGRAVVHGASPGHELPVSGLLLLDRPMQRRFESDPRSRRPSAAPGARPEGRGVRSALCRAVGDARDCQRSGDADARPRHADTPIPEVQLLSNGRYHVMVTNAGGGYSRWKDLAVTRWREDATCDNWGTFCYLRDVASGEFWSTAISRRSSGPKRYEAIFSEARAEFRRRDHDFETHTEIVVSPEDDIELRRMSITNRSRARRDDRGHQLRGSRARAACRGRAAPGVQQSLRADRDRPRPAGDPLHPPAALGRGARRPGCFT